MSGDQETRSQRYRHPAMNRSPWRRTIPDEVPEELHRRYMAREQVRKAALHAQVVVYYVRLAPDSARRGQVKIGHTTNLQNRLWQLHEKHGGGEPELLATEPGGEDLERERQRRFFQYGVALSYWHSEYFYPAQEIFDWAEQVRAYWGEPMLTGPIPKDWPWPL